MLYLRVHGENVITFLLPFSRPFFTIFVMGASWSGSHCGRSRAGGGYMDERERTVMTTGDEGFRDPKNGRRYRI